MILRRIRSTTPRSVLRWGCALRKKIRPISASGGRKRLASRIRSGRIGTARMISITTKSPYALQALVELGRCGGSAPVPIGELARRRDIPVQFLEQLFAVLRRAGVLRSQRGVKGGYSFAREPSEIAVLEIVELLDGPLGREATGIFADAAAAARNGFAPAPVGRRRRGGVAGGGRGDVLHLTVCANERWPAGSRRGATR